MNTTVPEIPKDEIRLYKAIEDVYNQMMTGKPQSPRRSIFDKYDDLVEEAITMTNGDGPALRTDPLTMNLLLKTDPKTHSDATYNEMNDIQFSKISFYEDPKNTLTDRITIFGKS